MYINDITILIFPDMSVCSSRTSLLFGCGKESLSFKYVPSSSLDKPWSHSHRGVFTFPPGTYQVPAAGIPVYYTSARYKVPGIPAPSTWYYIRGYWSVLVGRLL